MSGISFGSTAKESSLHPASRNASGGGNRDVITLKDSIEVKAAPEELFETISEQPAIFSCGWPGADRLRFGSDMPFGLVHVRVVTYDMPLDGEVTRGKNARIIGGSIPELFGLAGK